MADFGKHFTAFGIVALILGIVGLAWMLHTLWRNHKINQIRSWPKTNATIINALIEPLDRYPGTQFLDPQSFEPRRGDNAQYRPVVLYRYRVGNKEFQSTNLMYAGKKSYNALETKAMIGQFRAGETIEVLYNPSNNAESYIYNGAHNYWGVLWGILLILIAIFIYNKGTKKANTAKIGSFEVYNPNLTEIDDNIKRDVSALKESIQRTGSDLVARARALGRTNPSTFATMNRMDFY